MKIEFKRLKVLKVNSDLKLLRLPPVLSGADGASRCTYLENKRVEMLFVTTLCSEQLWPIMKGWGLALRSKPLENARRQQVCRGITVVYILLT